MSEETQPLSLSPSKNPNGATESRMIQAFETDLLHNSPVVAEQQQRDGDGSGAGGYLYSDEADLEATSPRKGSTGADTMYPSLSPTAVIPYHDHSSPHYTAFSKIFPYFILRRLFPPEEPRAVQLLRKENLAIPMCYLLVGIMQGLSGPFINVYPLFLGATEAQQVTISSIKSLPALFKLGFGFWSDNVLLWGYRRKSYMLLGWIMTSVSMICLLTFSDLSRVPVDNGGGNNNNNDDYYANGNDGNNVFYTPAENSPSVTFLSAMLLMFGTGFWFADVMGDSLVAEKAKLEPEETRGHLQSTCYSCRFFGLMITAPISTVLYSTYGPELVIKLLAFFPWVMVPFIYNLWERKDIEIKSTKDQCSEIWRTVCSRAVWQPMGFVYIYNVLQVGNAAWREYLRSILKFTDAQLNIMLIVAYVLLYVGVIAYKYYFIKWSWRTIYVFTTSLNAVFSGLQVLLIQGITFGLSPFVFALGDDIFADFLGGIQFLPTTIMMVHLCPAGSIQGITFGLSPFVFALGDDIFADFLGGIQFLASNY
eukprot:CAMPEP_0203683548 /NCGR_PEP_ID=MMETSP0090-20130426/47576_1 /ASSEMBLY_ACC=CAM_ASM_001088 /TAXON_ID=426623 /ORGANISM="Chaetoceros affinis, Strain CCMP159" /LENGTH=535 /DNA_ID=CAMNT_0050552697 /DNA_START=64 /DNA_END=1671 /DNA_ORIENTATION=-